MAVGLIAVTYHPHCTLMLEMITESQVVSCFRFSGGHEYFQTDAAKAQGSRLAAVAQDAALKVGGGAHWTMVHG